MITYGIDEVGRGAWAGPLGGAVVGLSENTAEHLLSLGLKDSKALSIAKREQLSAIIQAEATFCHISYIEVAEIDKYGIGKANIALFAALIGVCPAGTNIIIDGRPVPARLGGGDLPAKFLINGDALEPAIMAASVVAKVARDAQLTALHAEFPSYRFAEHKGYGTAAHLAALKLHGPCPHHRRSYAPIKRLTQTIDTAGGSSNNKTA